MSENLTKLLLIVISATVSISGYFLKNEIGRMVESTNSLQSSMGTFQLQLANMAKDSAQNARDLERLQAKLDKQEEQIKILQIDNVKRK